MVQIVLRKMIKNKWLIISLLVGNILLVSLTSSIPVYSEAILQRMFVKDMENYQIQNNMYPGTIVTNCDNIYIIPDTRRTATLKYDKAVVDNLINAFDVPPLIVKNVKAMTSVSAYPVVKREDNPKSRNFLISAMTGLENHIKITRGKMFKTGIVDGVMEVVMSEKGFSTQDILLNEEFELPTVLINEQPLKIKVVGVFVNSEENDIYWDSAPPTAYPRNVFIDMDFFTSEFLKEGTNSAMTDTWIIPFDYTKMKVADTADIIKTAENIKETLKKINAQITVKESFVDILKNYEQRERMLSVTLWVLQVPIYIILAIFIFMVSKLIVNIEKNEIAVLKSRGASRAQIIWMFLIQSVITLCISTAAGIPLGVLLCKLLGASNGFLELVQRRALPIAVTPNVLYYAAIAFGVSLITMMVPVILYSNVTIVKHKQLKGRKKIRSVWEKAFIDVILLGVSLYGLYTYSNQQEYLLENIGREISLDPLLFLSSTFFIIGAGLLCLRLFPYFIKLIFFIGRNIWPPSLYASFIKVGRSAGEEQFIMIFLILTLAMGIFDAKAARTINYNMEEQINYSTGAEITLKEFWASTSVQGVQAPTGMPQESGSAAPIYGKSDVVYYEPDYLKYLDFDEAETVTKVLNEKGAVRLARGTEVKTVDVMGIVTDEFGKTAWFRDGLLPSDWYNYLNVLAEDPNAVLLSRSFQNAYNAKIGERVYISLGSGDYAEGIIYGFVDYWPGFVPTFSTDSKTKEQTKQFDLVVANLSNLQSSWGVTPYEIWIKSKNSSGKFVYDFITENNIQVTKYTDSASLITTKKNDPIFQGTNGVLTVGFIITLVICTAGFLIYWILSIKSRVLQFGTFRAMGMPMRSVLAMLINEQVLISAVAVALGVLIGEICATLFVPLIQIGYISSGQVLPLTIAEEPSDYAKLYTVVGSMIVMCMFILGALISKIKIAQALKLGED